MTHTLTHSLGPPSSGTCNVHMQNVREVNINTSTIPQLSRPVTVAPYSPAQLVFQF